MGLNNRITEELGSSIWPPEIEIPGQIEKTPLVCEATALSIVQRSKARYPQISAGFSSTLVTGAVSRFIKSRDGPVTIEYMACLSLG